MARPKTKSKLTEGIAELVESIRTIESKLNLLIKSYSKLRSAGKRGRPPGSGAKRGRGRPAGKRGPGRPAGSGIKRKPGRPAGSKKRGRGRPPGSKNKK